MVSQNHNPMAISPQPAEAASLHHLERLLASGSSQARLIGINGETEILPESIYQVLCQVVRAMAAGNSISLVPSHRELTTQEAADTLNVSRPYLIGLLEKGEIPFTKVGSHRRIRLQDIMTYQQKRDRNRRQTLREFTGFLQDEGFYDG
jgi:excisionase family DNA binding protein